MKANIELDQSVLNEIGFTVDQLREAITNALGKLHHPVDGNPIYFNNIDVTVNAASDEMVFATIKNIDTTKPLVFYGARDVAGVSTPFTDQVILPSGDAKALLTYVSECYWNKYFNENLQSLAQTKEGDLLLTGWMSPATFACFVCDAAPGDAAIRKILDGLKEATSEWSMEQVEIVYFDGYRLNV